MKLCLLLGGFIAVCYEFSGSSRLRNRKAACTSVNKAQKRSVRGARRIIQGNMEKYFGVRVLTPIIQRAVNDPPIQTMERI